jgi:hypothetical protein
MNRGARFWAAKQNLTKPPTVVSSDLSKSLAMRGEMIHCGPARGRTAQGLLPDARPCGLSRMADLRRRVADGFRLPLDDMDHFPGLQSALQRIDSGSLPLGPRHSRLEVRLCAERDREHRLGTDFGYVVVLSATSRQLWSALFTDTATVGLAALGSVTKGQVIGYLTSVRQTTGRYSSSFRN